MLCRYYKRAHYTEIKLFNKFPSTITNLNHDIKVFKPALIDYLLAHSYSVQEFTLITNSQVL
jgi:hypothetical protein